MEKSSKKRFLKVATIIGFITLAVTVIVGLALAALPREDFDTSIPANWEIFTDVSNPSYPGNWNVAYGKATVADENWSKTDVEAWMVTNPFRVGSNNVLIVSQDQIVASDYAGSYLAGVWMVQSEDYPSVSFPDHSLLSMIISNDLASGENMINESLASYAGEDIRLVFVFDSDGSGSITNTWDIDYVVVSGDETVETSTDDDDDDDSTVTDTTSGGDGCNISGFTYPLFLLLAPLAFLARQK